MVRSRPVESSGHTSGTRTWSSPSTSYDKARRVAPRAGIELLADASRDLPVYLPRVDDRVHAAVNREQPARVAEVRLHRRLHVRVLQLAGKLRAVEPARPLHLPERCRSGRLVLERGELVRPVGPNSAIMRRFTNGQPIGGASLWSFCNSSTYSGGSRSGMVAISCATFMIGPFSPPSAAASSEHCARGRAAAEQTRPPQSVPRRRSYWSRRAHSAPRGPKSGFSRCPTLNLGTPCRH